MQSNRKLPAQVMDPKWMSQRWRKDIAIADKYNEPGKLHCADRVRVDRRTLAAATTCTATSSTVMASRQGEGMLPLTTFQTQDPEKLWKWMSE